MNLFVPVSSKGRYEILMGIFRLTNRDFFFHKVSWSSHEALLS